MNEEYREYTEIVRLVWPDWEISEKIGRGAFASVYRASRRNGSAWEKDAAIKIIRIPNSDSDLDLILAEGRTPEQAEMYFRDVVEDSLKEIRAMEELSGNTNIVSIFDYKVHKVSDRPVWYILIRMEYLQKVDPVSLCEEEIIRLGMDVCTALSICRKKNIVHRDVSLDNIFVHDGNYKLGDFGVAKVLEGVAVTMHTVAGKPLYMAPEVYNATLEDTDIDQAAKVDIYSLGILMYRLANQMMYPFENAEEEFISLEERTQAFKRRIIDGEDLPAPKDASPGLTAIILKACAAHPDKRYDSADAMKKDLLALAGDQHSNPARFHWKKAALIFAALAVLGCACFFLLKPVLFPEWTKWSEWSDTRQTLADPNRTQEEVKQQFEWSNVQCPACGAYNPAAGAVCTVCKSELPADLVRRTKVTDDSTSQVVDGAPGVRLFDNIPYWYSGTVTRYRYRARIQREEDQEPSGESAFCHDWYYSTYENAEDYPGIVFKADGDGGYFSVTSGEKLYLIDHRDGRTIKTKEAFLEDGILTVGSEKYTLENGKLVHRYGPVTETYTREPQERQIPADLSSMYAKELRPEHYNGTWTIIKYGMHNAFADAETMNITGKAVIEDGKITVAWTRNGQEKSFEQTFDEELNNGCLYTVVEDTVSYIVSMRNDHTILLNIGASQIQWVMRRENVIDETVVHPDVPGFEQAFSKREDWSVSEDTRNELADLLLQAAVAGGVDPASIRTDGPFYLGLINKAPGYPVLICEGTGDYKHYLLRVGRGVQRETGVPFVYYEWTDRFFSSLVHPEKTIAEYYQEETLHVVCGEKIWSVRAVIE